VVAARSALCLVCGCVSYIQFYILEPLI
jgi:hypothetical protein